MLIGILLPALAAARQTARSIKSLSNVRQIGSVAMYNFLSDENGKYPWHSSVLAGGSRPDGSTKPRWADFLQPYVNNTEVFVSPMINLSEASPDAILGLRFWHEVAREDAMQVAMEALVNGGTANVTARAYDEDELSLYGGYGYNYQYLGNGRNTAGYDLPFRAVESDIPSTSQTVVIGDTEGANEGRDGQYALDPPLESARGSGRPTGYYGSSHNPNARSRPSERNRGRGAFVFADGHGEAMTRDALDNFDGDGDVDNGYWNGYADADVQ
ncbi:MAG: hypothetical protein WD009_03900, partial [Phycisphaeraceae bacterium]